MLVMVIAVALLFLTVTVWTWLLTPRNWLPKFNVAGVAETAAIPLPESATF